MSRYGDFLVDNCVALAKVLGDDFVVNKSRHEISRPTEYGRDVIILGGSGKYSPMVSVGFHFGISFACARELERRVDPSAIAPCYDIFQYSLNRKSMRWLWYFGPSSWSFDLNAPSGRLVDQLARAVKRMAYPFFNRFGSVRAARDAICEDHSWCLGGTSSDWRRVLILDACLGELEHFRTWSESLSEFARKQSQDYLATVERELKQEAPTTAGRVR
jgi:hypothetical protein